MLSAETKRRIDAARDILVGKLPLPTEQVELITLALIYKFMDDLAQEAFEKFQATQKFLATHAREIRTVFMGFLLDNNLRNLILSGDFARLSATDSVVFHSLQRLEADERQTLLGYLKENNMFDGAV